MKSNLKLNEKLSFDLIFGKWLFLKLWSSSKNIKRKKKEYLFGKKYVLKDIKCQKLNGIPVKF